MKTFPITPHHHHTHVFASDQPREIIFLGPNGLDFYIDQYRYNNKLSKDE